MKSFINEFKEFAVKGNMMDMAIGIIIGASFNKVIDVLVKKIVMPPLSLFTNGLNFQNQKLILRDGETNAQGKVIAEEIAIGYGAFIEVMIDFFIISLTIFILVKFMNRLRNQAQDTKDTKVATPKDIELLSRIGDLIEEQNKLIINK